MAYHLKGFIMACQLGGGLLWPISWGGPPIGLPSLWDTWVSHRLARLISTPLLPAQFSLFSIDSRFQGEMRALSYTNCTDQNIKPPLLHYDGAAVQRVMGSCTLLNPCQNGGICLRTHEGVTCDCSQTAHYGRHCEMGECW